MYTTLENKKEHPVLPSFKEIFSEWGNLERKVPFPDGPRAPSPPLGLPLSPWIRGTETVTGTSARLTTYSPLPIRHSPQHLEHVHLPPLRSEFHPEVLSVPLQTRFEHPVASHEYKRQPLEQLCYTTRLPHLSSDSDSDDDIAINSSGGLHIEEEEEEELSSGALRRPPEISAVGDPTDHHAKFLLQAVKHIQKNARRAKPQRVCVSCGSKSTPQWRSGPSGRGTLCNACGLKERKRSKKAEQVLRCLHNVIVTDDRKVEYAA